MRIVNLKSIPHKRSGSGIDALFYTVEWEGEKLGLKTFDSFSECEAVKWNQRKAAKAGIGPQVRSPTFKVIEPFGSTSWGYLTELAKVQDKVYPEDVLDKLDSEFNEVFGFYHPDFHEMNIGYLKNGKLVYIDFGF